MEALLEANKEKPPKTWPITYDDRYRTLTKFAMDPVGLPETTGSDLMNKITLPDSVYTSVWLIPLIDSRLWYGEPAKKFTDLTPQMQEKYATKEVNQGDKHQLQVIGATFDDFFGRILFLHLRRQVRKLLCWFSIPKPRIDEGNEPYRRVHRIRKRYLVHQI